MQGQPCLAPSGSGHRITAVNVCTIASRGQLAWARVLVASFREHDPRPDTEFTVLLLDGVPGADRIEGARVRALEELLDDDERGLTVAGNPREALEAAILPRLLERLLAEGASRVAYLAPGLRVLGPLVELERMLEGSELVLVARAGAGSRTPDETFAGQSGGGALSRRLLALHEGESADAVLAEWPRWFKDGGSAVQAWFDGLPAIAQDVAVLRDPGYGLDPWALGISLTDGNHELLVEPSGKPARLFDFSSLDPLLPDRLCDADGTLQLSSNPPLAELCRREAQELLDAGWQQDVARVERLEVLADGTRMTPTLRKLLVEGVHEGALTRSPYGDAGRDAFFAYLNEPAERGRAVGLTRLHQAIWENRVDLQGAYPHLDGPDGSGYAGWLCVHGPEQEGLSPSLLPPAPAHIHRDNAPNLHEREELWGVNVAGFFTSELGVGEAARLLIAGLDAAEVPALPIQGHLAPSSRRSARFASAAIDEAPYPINILCINGDGVPVFAREAGQSFFENRHTIALWWWEVGDPPPGWLQAFEFVDEVWAASQHIYDAIAPTAPVPVVRVRLPVVAPNVIPRTRAELGLPEDGFLFLYVHDYHSVATRKNPLGAVEAFKRAFPPDHGAKLVVKSINAGSFPHEHDRVVLAAGAHPDIALIEAYVSAEEKNAMIAACDCYVSLHRSEGFGLTVAEAMLLGKPVIATRYGGTLEFMNERNSYLVDWQPVAVGEDAHPYAAAGIWAEPDLDQAAALMREVLKDPQQARERGARARSDVSEQHSPQVAGESLSARLRLIHQRRVGEGRKTLNVAHLPALELYELPELIESEAKGPSGRAAGIKRVARAAMTRLLRPFLARQRAVDARLLDSIERLDRRLHEVTRALHDQQQAQHAETMAAVRRLEATRPAAPPARAPEPHIQPSEQDRRPAESTPERQRS
jgi:glycosyltransferase involved in cell wall biosynthesis